MNNIVIKGARENNLKNIDITIPRNKIVCFVGVSGSGKSTLAFDIIAKEGQRQYFESLSSLARRYLAKSNRPDIDEIKGISSAIVINQSRVHSSPRSTVGTMTEAYTYLRLLFARAGYPILDSSYFSFNHPHGACEKCKGLGKAVSIDPHKLLDFNKSLNEGAIIHSDWKVDHMRWSIIKATSFFNMAKKIRDYSDKELEKLLYAPKQKIEDNSDYHVIRWTYAGLVTYIMGRNTKIHRGPTSNDLQYCKFVPCDKCNGWRLNQQSLEVKINGKNIGEVANLPLTKAIDFIINIEHRNAEVIKPRLIEQLQYLIDAGVGYLSLNRSTDTLSGGEAQRVKLARQIGCDLTETIYVLDEPTRGLHPKDTNIVLKNLHRLRDGNNTVLLVEHDPDIISQSEHIIELGPGGGSKGGEVIHNGSFESLLANEKSPTGKYFKNRKINLKENVRKPKGYISITNAKKHNLKNISVDIPLNCLVALTGISGSGKSSLVEEIIDQQNGKINLIDQKSIGNNKRGCIGTYIGIFDEIRKLFAKENNVSQPLFSYNSIGACEECKGLGFIDMDMNFLGDVRMKCEKCNGKRYKDEVLKYKYKGWDISEVLNMTASEILSAFHENIIVDKVQLLEEVGLDYIEIGQTLDTLSGGESQRLKLASRLQNKGDFYILDEPTSGLHPQDISRLLNLLNKLVDIGNTVLVVEHNLDIIRQSDYIIDLGPEGGEEGGYLLFSGKPEDIRKCERSYTGRYL